jgi:type I restriction enzyme S subunit
MSVPALRFPEFEGDWEASTIGDSIVTMRGGAPLAPTDFVEKSEFEVIPKKAISGGGRLQLDSSGTFTTSAFFQKYDKSQVNSSYLITTLRDLVPSGPSIGFIVKFSSDKTYLLAQGVYGFVLEQNKLLREFLIMFSNRIEYRREMQRIMVGSTQVHVRNGDFKKVALALPTINEQKKIAAFLGVVDEKLAALRARRAGLETHKRGLMQKLFSRTLRFTKPDGTAFPDWEEKRLGEVAPLQRGFDLPTVDVKSGDVPVVYSNGILRTHAEAKVCGPGVVTGRSGTIGNIHYVETDFWPHNTSLWVTNFCGNIPRFVYFLFCFLKFERYGAGSGVPTLNRNDIHRVKQAIPHPNEQRLIADALQAMDAKIQTATDQITRMETFKKGLLQQMFV